MTVKLFAIVSNEPYFDEFWGEIGPIYDNLEDACVELSKNPTNRYIEELTSRGKPGVAVRTIYSVLEDKIVKYYTKCKACYWEEFLHDGCTLEEYKSCPDPIYCNEITRWWDVPIIIDITNSLKTE